MNDARLVSLAVILLPALMAAAHAAEAPLQLGARAGLNYSDNVRRTATDEISSGSAIVGVEAAGSHQGNRLDYTLFGDMEYQSYFDDSFANDLVGRVTATGDYRIIPETLIWNAAAYYSQIRADLLQAAAPGNREDVISLATGPQLQARLTSSLLAQFEGRYVTTDYSKRDFDNDILGARLILGHPSGKHNLFGVGAGYDRVEYASHTQPGAIDYNRREGFLRFQATGSRTDIYADLGYAKIDSGNTDTGGPAVWLRATRRITPSLSAYLAYTQEYTTLGNTVATTSGSTTTDDDSILTAAPRLVRYGAFGLAFSHSRTDYDVMYRRSRENAQLGVDGERTTNEIRGSLGRRFAERVHGSLYGSMLKEKSTLVGLDVKEKVAGARLDVSVGRMLTLDMHIEHRDRDSDLIQNTYKETVGGLYIHYGRVNPAAVEAVTAPIAR